MTRHGFTIQYQLITCDRCHVQRIRGVPCPDCGKRPATWEVDQHLQRRQRQVAGIKEQLTAADTSEQTGHFISEDIFDEILGLVPRLAPALQRVTETDGDADALRQLVADLVDVRHRCARSKERRPYIAVARSAAEIVHELEQAISLYLDALTATVMAQAQAHSEKAQRHIDRSAAAFTKMEAALDAARSVDTSSVTAMITSLLEAQMLQFGQDVLGMIASADTRITELLKVKNPQAGLQLALIEGVAALEFDQARLTKTVIDAYQTFLAAGPALAQLATTEPELVNDFLDVQVGAFNSCWTAMHAVENAQTIRQATEALLDVNVALLEAPGAFFARTLLLVTGHKASSYSKLKSGNATEDLRTLQAARPELASLLGGIDDHLRTAKGHYLVTYTDEAIITTTKRETRTTDLVDLHDLVLTGVESVMACVVALRQAFAELGIDIDDTQLTLDLGVSTLDLAEMAVSLIAETDTTVRLVDEEIVVELAGSPQHLRLTSLVAGLGPALNEAEQFRVIDHGGDRILTGPTAPFRDHLQGGFAKQLRVIQVALTCRLNGTPCINQDQVRVWVSDKAINALTVGDQESMHQLRDLTRLAQQSGDPELEAAMRRSRSWLRQGEGNLELVELLRSWRFSGADWEAV